MEDILITKKYKAGETIVSEGFESYNVYIVLSGEATATKNHFGREVDIKEFKKGDVFGALSLITKTPRSATVKAKTDLELGMIYKDDFMEVIQKLPGDIRTIMQELMEELKGSYDLSANLVDLLNEVRDIKQRIDALKQKEMKKSLDKVPKIFQTIFLSLDNSLTEMVHNIYAQSAQLDKAVIEIDAQFKKNLPL